MTEEAWQTHRSPLKRLVPVIGASLLLIVYGLTMAPTLSWSHHGADGGDLVRAVAEGSIPHPPGFPTYLVLGEIFIRLPLRNPAWRLNLMSAVAAAAAVGITIAAVQRLPGRVSRFSALSAGLSLGLAPLFWSQALITEVYAPAALFASTAILLSLREAAPWMRGAVWGLGIGAHPTLVFLAPLVLHGALARGRGGARVRSAVWVGVAALAGWGAMVGPVLLARNGAPSPWADVDTLGGWWALVSGQLYRSYVFGLPLVAWPRRLAGWAGILVRQFTPVGVLLAGAGWLALWREARRLAVSSLVAFGCFSIYALGHDTTDSLVYLVPALPLAALWVGLGLDRAVEWLWGRLEDAGWIGPARWSPVVVLLIPLVQAVAFWDGMDLSGDWTAMAWVERTLEEAPPRAVLLTDSDAHTFTLWYAQEVLERRPDIVVIDRDLWYQDVYRQQIAGELALSGLEPTISAEAAARRTGRPLVSAAD